MPGRIKKTGKLGCRWRMPYAEVADPRWYWNSECGGWTVTAEAMDLVVWEGRVLARATADLSTT